MLRSAPPRIFKDSQLKNMQISFAMWHFTCTSIVLWIASRRPFNLFVPVRLPFVQMIPLCSFFAGFLILGNLSLAYNSIGFYQYVPYATPRAMYRGLETLMGETQTGQNHDNALRCSASIPFPGKDCHTPYSVRPFQRLRRSRTDKYGGRRDYYPWSLHSHGCFHSYRLLSGLDRKEDEGFCSLESAVVVESSTNQCVASGAVGTLV